MAKVIGWILGILSIGFVGMFFDKGEVLAGIISLFAIGFFIPPILNKINASAKNVAEEKGKKPTNTSQRSANVLGVVLVIIAAVVGSEAQTESEKVEVTKTINYKTIGKREYSFNGRKRLGVFVYAPEAKTREERAAVVKQAAIDLQETTNADFVDALLEVADFNYGSGNILAMADYAPDGCGTSGQDCSGNKWKIKASDVKVTELQIKVLKEWEKLKPSFQGSKGYLDLEDEAKISSSVAKNLKISIEEVMLPMVVGTAKDFTSKLDGSIKVIKSN